MIHRIHICNQFFCRPYILKSFRFFLSFQGTKTHKKKRKKTLIGWTIMVRLFISYIDFKILFGNYSKYCILKMIYYLDQFIEYTVLCIIYFLLLLHFSISKIIIEIDQLLPWCFVLYYCYNFIILFFCLSLFQLCLQIIETCILLIFLNICNTIFHNYKQI